jgi:hypothetical protein
LSKFRTALCGELIFVCLADDGPSLSDWLSPHYETYVQWFATDSLYRQIWEWDADFDCNWKIPIENTLESYHVNQLHPTTLLNYPREEAVRHELHERYTVHDCETEFPQYRRQVESLSRLLGSPATHMYRHHHVHPHVVITSHDLWRIAQVYVPTSRTKCWMRLKLFAYQGGRRGFIGNLIRRRLRRVLPRQLQAVTREDIGVYADVQRGIRSSRYRGIIGTREERIHTFHDYLLKACGLENPQIGSD